MLFGDKHVSEEPADDFVKWSETHHTQTTINQSERWEIKKEKTNR